MDAKKPPLWGAVRKDNQKQRAESTANAAISMLDQLTFQPEIARSQFDIEAELLRKKFMEPKKRQQEGPTEYELDVLHNQTMALLDWVQQFKEGKWAEDSRCDNHRIDEAQQNLAKLVEEEAAVLAAGAAPAAEPLSLYKISITPQPPHQGAESEPRPEEVALCSRLEEVLGKAASALAVASPPEQDNASGFLADFFKQQQVNQQDQKALQLLKQRGAVAERLTISSGMDTDG